MPADEHDEQPAQPTPDSPDETPASVETRGATPARRRRGWRRVVNRRNAILTAVVGVIAVIALALIIFVLYRSGRVDQIIAGQIIGTLAEYNIRAEIGSFRAQIGPRTAEIKDLKLYNAVTGAPIGNVGRIVATIRVEDLWALSLRRSVNLESLTVERPEIWVTYDAQGRSNFAGLKVPPPDPNQRILFAYSTANVSVTDGIVHYDDRRYDINGEAKNLKVTVRPEDPNAPAASRADLVDLSMSDSTFTTSGHSVSPVDIEAHARVNQTSADINQLVIRSPVAEATLSGTLDDWRALRYHMKVNASVDLTQTSDALQLQTALRGTGKFDGTVEGEGDKYKVVGSGVSDALAADNIRLKALSVNATASGQGSSYEAQGRAVAELLSAGDFRLDLVQMVGGVTGTGTDFRWLGELRAAAAREGATSVVGLIMKDAVAEMHDGELSGSASSASATTVTAQGARAGGLQISDAKFSRGRDGRTHATVAGMRAGSIVAQGTTVAGVQASGIDASVNADNSASVTVSRVIVAGLNAAGARTGSLNIAGVRLAISPGGRVEGTTGDINAGTVAFTMPPASKGGAAEQGRVDDVRLARPRFTLEPGGRYRASMDLSLGGGVLGTLNLGKARAGVVASNGKIQLSDFDADIFGGHARGGATIATAGRATTSVNASFEGVDAGGLVALVSGNAVPLTGAATGTVDLRFPGTNFKLASGRLDATFNGATGREASARTPLTGTIALTADRGLFQIERANLHAGATDVTATGRFSFEGGSDLAVKLDSTDASEFQNVLLSTGLLPSVEQKAKDFGVQLAGSLNFDGTVTGALDSPVVNGHFALASLTANGQDLGALSADIASDATATRVNNGSLRQAGGGVNFTAVIPRAGENNVTLDATLENANVGSLAAAFGSSFKSFNPQSLAGLGPATGKLSVAGLPGAMSGSADVRVADGRIGGQPYDEIVARASFNGSNVSLDNFDVRLGAGHVTATGAVDIGEGGGHAFPNVTVRDFRVQGTNVQIAMLAGLFSSGKLPQLSGTANFTATLSGNLLDPRTLKADINAQGSDVSVNGQPAGQLTLVGHMDEQQRFTADLTTELLGQPQAVHAVVDLGSENWTTTVETTLTNADLTPLFATILNNPNVHVSGHATGTLRASGNLLSDDGEFTTAGVAGRAEFTDLSVQVEDVPLTAENPLVVTFKPNEVTFERTHFTGPGTNITIGGTAALAAGGTNNATVNGDLNMRVLSNAQQNFFLAGVASVRVNLGGTFDAPQVTGTASVANASLALLVSDERLTATEINGLVRFNADQASIETLTGRLGGGRFSASGGASLAGFRPREFLVTARGTNVTVPFPQDFSTTADAELEVRGSLERQIVVIGGNVNVRRSEYTKDIDLADIINRHAEAPITEGGGGGPGLFGAQTSLDLTIQGQDALVVRNNLADIVGSVNLRVFGPMDDPVISGRISATHGTVAFRNNRYDVQRALIELPPRADADPVINLQAQSDIKGYRVTVTMSGPLSGGLTTTATSDPALPQADVIALITTGNLSSGPEGASTVAQTGIGTATSLLTDTLINAPVERATDKLFGLNRFEFDPIVSGESGQSPTARLTVGRQVNRNLAITYSTNVTGVPDQVIAVEYRVSDRLSFVAQYQQGSTDTLRSRNNNFSFELRFRKRY
ncbi:MAG TPA: translocation/assembly module TamB domain-containing protein [Pyrinomonadaceae bacterium]|nr:translocation/assembly module TamB domain-containing protein [Pyrinomonadaceae bacterium]